MTSKIVFSPARCDASCHCVWH